MSEHSPGPHDVLFSRYIDGELTPLEAEELERVIAEVPGAAERLEELVDDHAVLASMAWPAPPARVALQVRKVVREPAPATRATRVTLFAAAAVVLLGLGALGARWLSTGPGSPAPPPEVAVVAPPEEGDIAPGELPAPVAPPVEPAADAAVPVRFVYVSEGAKTVHLVGDFNGWSEASTALRPTAVKGVFAATVNIPRGEHEYMFLVDGERWVTDPLASLTRSDDFGRDNAVMIL